MQNVQGAIRRIQSIWSVVGRPGAIEQYRESEARGVREWESVRGASETTTDSERTHHIAECIHVDDVDVRGREEDVLDERREHVPGVKRNERSVEPQAVRRHERDDNGAEDGIREDIAAVCRSSRPSASATIAI